jgi:hypothetical protein
LNHVLHQSSPKPLEKELPAVKELSRENVDLNYQTENDVSNMKLDTYDVIIGITCDITTLISEEAVKEIENTTMNKDNVNALLSNYQFIM